MQGAELKNNTEMYLKILKSEYPVIQFDAFKFTMVKTRIERILKMHYDIPNSDKFSSDQIGFYEELLQSGNLGNGHFFILAYHYVTKIYNNKAPPPNF